MFLPWKLTLPNLTAKINLIIILIVLVVVILILAVTFGDFCGLRHISLLSDIKKIEEDYDPEVCESLIFKIENFNSQCTPMLETLDCG